MFRKAFFLFVFSVSLVSGQGIITNEAEQDLSKALVTEQQESNFLSQQYSGAIPPDSFTSDNSGIFINQIGDENYSNIIAESRLTDIRINQIGDLHQIDLDLKADIIDYRVLQQGRNNRLLDFQNLDGKQLIERNVIQNGSNQNLIIHGRNSIVDRMSIQMNGGSQNLVIRNTN